MTKDDTLLVGTRTAGIWRLVNGEWRLFAEGLFDSLGVVAEDDRGLIVVAGQKPELTRISDVNGDGIADKLGSLTQTKVHPQQTGRVYHARLAAKTLFDASAPEQLDAYYTLHRFPVER